MIVAPRSELLEELFGFMVSQEHADPCILVSSELCVLGSFLVGCFLLSEARVLTALPTASPRTRKPKLMRLPPTQWRSRSRALIGAPLGQPLPRECHGF